MEENGARKKRNVAIDCGIYQAITDAVEWIKNHVDPGYSVADLLENAAFVELVRLRAAYIRQLEGANFPHEKGVRRGRPPQPDPAQDGILRPHVKATQKIDAGE